MKMVDVTRGTLLQQSQNTVIGSVQEERELSSLEKMFDVANKYAYNQHRQEREATAALEGLQMAAAGETLSNIKAGTPLADTIMNIDARAKQAEAYYSKIKAAEITSTVWQENAEALADKSPQEATTLVYQLVREKAQKVAGDDNETLNTIMVAATPTISQMYGAQATAYAQRVQKRYNEAQQADIVQNLRGRTVALENLKKDPNNPAAVAAAKTANENLMLTLVPDPNIPNEVWQENVKVAMGHFATIAGTTNPDGSYNGIREFNDFMDSPTFKALPVSQQDGYQKMRDHAEKAILQNLPPELANAEIRLRAQAQEGGKESAEQYNKRLLEYDQYVRQAMGLRNNGPINQDQRQALVINKQHALRSEQEKIENRQLAERMAATRNLPDATRFQNILEKPEAVLASGIEDGESAEKLLNESGVTPNFVDPDNPSFNVTMRTQAAVVDALPMGKRQFAALTEAVRRPDIDPQHKEDMTRKLARAAEKITVIHGPEKAARIIGEDYGVLMGALDDIKAGNIASATWKISNPKPVEQNDKNNKRWAKATEKERQNWIANKFGLSRAKYSSDQLDSIRPQIEARIHQVHRDFGYEDNEEGWQRAFDHVMDDNAPAFGIDNSVIIGKSLHMKAIKQYHEKQQAAIKKGDTFHTPKDDTLLQETVAEVVLAKAKHGWNGAEKIADGQKIVKTTWFPQIDAKTKEIFWGVDILLENGKHKQLNVTQDEMAEYERMKHNTPNWRIQKVDTNQEKDLGYSIFN
jgi:hypothetical protein